MDIFLLGQFISVFILFYFFVPYLQLAFTLRACTFPSVGKWGAGEGAGASVCGHRRAPDSGG